MDHNHYYPLAIADYQGILSDPQPTEQSISREKERSKRIAISPVNEYFDFGISQDSLPTPSLNKTKREMVEKLELEHLVCCCTC